MRFAIIGDIHSNKFALDSVFKDINDKKVDFIISTGDLVGYLAFPNEVIEMMREHKVLVVQGNHDKRIGDSEKVNNDIINVMSEEEIQKKASLVFTNWIISDDNRRYLKNLPTRLKLVCGKLEILVVHGSHRAIDEYLYEDKEYLSQFEKTVQSDVIICGHTHIPYYLKIGDKHFINAGSVGKPKHGDSRATYVIVDIQESKVKCEIIKVSYDVESMVKAIKENNMIYDKLIPMIEKGY
ncbi:metallophosphoesterase family protein [Clostridium sp. DL1XJH146]